MTEIFYVILSKRAECEGLDDEKMKSLKSANRRHVYCERSENY